jgi:chromodomain-helicase-DNA-binding protein 4
VPPSDDSGSESTGPLELNELSLGGTLSGSALPPEAGKLVQGPNDDTCGLCGLEHRSGACYMTESSENLAEYRLILMMHAADEPIQERVGRSIAFSELRLTDVTSE